MLKKVPFIINSKGEIIVIKSKGLLKKIVNEKLYKIQYGYIELRGIDYKII
jgi:hypothetical protein